VVVLIRSWNVFHGNASPPRRRSYLEEMVRLATDDRPDVLLLQELPAWALGRLGTWSGMQPLGDVVRKPRLPVGARAVTALHLGLLRSLLGGQANAILLAPGLRVLSRNVLVLNPRRGLGVGPGERRICQVARVEGDGGRTLLLGNLHASNAAVPAREQAARAAARLDELARPGDVVVLGGDFNVEGDATAPPGFSAPGPGIDHVLVRGAEASAQRAWPDERRRRDGILLSDHAPVEITL
jgi:endonuclease/exonuclease/phosphatase family metal-dependent hydrolase